MECLRPVLENNGEERVDENVIGQGTGASTSTANKRFVPNKPPVVIPVLANRNVPNEPLVCQGKCCCTYVILPDISQPRSATTCTAPD